MMICVCIVVEASFPSLVLQRESRTRCRQRAGCLLLVRLLAILLASLSFAMYIAYCSNLDRDVSLQNGPSRGFYRKRGSRWLPQLSCNEQANPSPLQVRSSLSRASPPRNVPPSHTLTSKNESCSYHHEALNIHLHSPPWRPTR